MSGNEKTERIEQKAEASEVQLEPELEVQERSALFIQCARRRKAAQAEVAARREALRQQQAVV